MRFSIVFLLIIAAIPLAAQNLSEEAVNEIMDYRQEQTETFKSEEESPLSTKERKKFKGLNYFPIDLKYRVVAKFTKNQFPEYFQMQTTTDRMPQYTVYGWVVFELEGQQFKVPVYYQKNQDRREKKYRKYLFMPFTDLTNGESTYEGGRYLGFDIPEGNEVVIDFNKSYNPYCHYSKYYSCPIVPRENYLDIEIQAGEKKYLARK